MSSSNTSSSTSAVELVSKEPATKRNRRTSIPDKPNYSLNLWSIMKNCIGKELSKIPMPVNFNEPLSMLQRLTEDLEYHELLDKASKCENALEQLCYVAAFTVSSYSTTVFRTGKPFNPLLGETFELDRLEDEGFSKAAFKIHALPAVQRTNIDDLDGQVQVKADALSFIIPPPTTGFLSLPCLVLTGGVGSRPGPIVVSLSQISIKNNSNGFNLSSYVSPAVPGISLVSHHPPAAAHHVDSKYGWTLRQEIAIASKFRGKYLSIMPL
eukprot:g43767.t1